MMGSGGLLEVLARAGMVIDCMLVTYLDESGHSGDSRIVSMGGIVGTHLVMEQLGERWKQMLLRHSVDVFHMSELEGSLGEFAGWDKDRREALLADVMNCFNDLFFCFIGMSTIVDQYRSLPGVAQDMLADPWFICFQTCVHFVSTMLMWQKSDPSPNEKIAFFHDQQAEYQSRAASAFQFIKEKATSGNRIGTCTPASKKDIIQLQAADLVAYEVRKLIENARYSPSVPMRWPMRQIQKHACQFCYMDFSNKVLPLDGGPITTFTKYSIMTTHTGMYFAATDHKWPNKPWEKVDIAKTIKDEKIK